MTSLLDVPVPTLDGAETDLSAYAGDVLLVVNVASKCGFTPQYSELQQLQDTYAEQGFTVVGFPCNQFLFQEPGGADKITSCGVSYGVTFPVLGKVRVNGLRKHPLFKALRKAKDPKGKGGVVRWNFEKFLVSRDGEVLQRWRSTTRPQSSEVVAAIEQALATGAPAAAATPAPAEVAPAESYDGWTLAQLRERAAERGVPGRSRMSKADLVAALSAG